jgi:hypothetical protein
MCRVLCESIRPTSVSYRATEIEVITALEDPVLSRVKVLLTWLCNEMFRIRKEDIVLMEA